MMITAVVLCGGQGTRLRPVISDLPKCLAPVNGVPFLSYVLTHLYRQGVRKTVLCTGYRSGMVEATYGNRFHLGGRPESVIDLVYSVEKEPLGTGGALRNALPLIDSDPFLVVNGDTFSRFNLHEFVNAAGMYNLKNIVVKYYKGGDLLTSINSGVFVLVKDFLETIPKNTCIGLEECLKEYKDKNKVSIELVWFSSRPFLDIGTPEGYASAEGFLREQGVIL